MKQLILLAISCVAVITPLRAGSDSLSLSGTWRFHLDPSDLGLNENWHNRRLPHTIEVPADLAEQGIGDPPSLETRWIGDVQRQWWKDSEHAPYISPEDFKFPYWLTPEHRYMGASWFQREFSIPAAWSEKRVLLHIERPHWETRAWLDGKALGTRDSLGTPHQYDLGILSPGTHVLTVRVDNRLIVDVGINSHSVSDHTQGNWHGMVGTLELRATPLVSIDDLNAYPGSSSVLVRGKIRNFSGIPGSGTLMASVQPKSKRRSAATFSIRLPVSWSTEGGSFEAEIAVPEPQLWDEFNPSLYQLGVRIEELHSPAEISETVFGFRNLSTHGTEFTLNGRPIFFRGTLECAIFPRTGHPPTDPKAWRRIIGVAKAHGLNMIRFHSWCPPEAAFRAADDLGFYLQVEASSWANQSTTLGDGKPVDAWIYRETDAILKHYGNHPSFVLMTYGNEPGGAHHSGYLAKWTDHFKKVDARRLYTGGAGWPQIAENQFHVTPDPRVQGWGEGNRSRINARPPETITDYRDYIQRRSVPVISHEIGQWCVYPNFKEIKKYSGYLKPRNFEIFRDRLHSSGMLSLSRDFLIASGKLQALCYKEDIESALRTPGMGGFQLLDLHDFPGQGTALVGVLDPFWEEKGYVSPKQFRRFCNSTVPLVRLPKRVFTTAEQLSAEVQVAHFGDADLRGAVAEWQLASSSGKILRRGRLASADLPAGRLSSIGDLHIEFKDLSTPSQLNLRVRLIGTEFINDWDLWLYPSSLDSPDSSDCLVTSVFATEAEELLSRGGRVLLTLPARQVRNYEQDPVKLGFSSIFWNTAWTGRQAPTTLGLLCRPEHPALASFPTDSHSNWQWWYLVHRAGALRLDQLPPATDPIVRIIDDWVTARPLGLIVEGAVGKGRIVICGFDLTRDLTDPVSRQMRSSLVRYLSSSASTPKVQFSASQIRSLIQQRSAAALHGVKSVTASSAQPDYSPDNIIDGDPSTLWHTSWADSPPAFPHELILEIDKPTSLSGLTFLPRQDGNPNGWIKSYEIALSTDGTSWAPAVTGEFPRDADLKTVTLPSPAVGVRFVKLRALSGHANGPWASLAEINILRTNPAPH